MTLRTRLTLLYTGLLTLLLLLLALLVLTVMRNSLLSGVDTDLRDAYSQFSNIAERLGVRPFSAVRGSGDVLPDPFATPATVQDSLASIRRNFPNYRVQFEPYIGQDLRTLEELAEGTPQQRAEVLAYMRAEATQRRQTPSVDPNAPITLTDAQLLRLLTGNDHSLLLTLPVKDVGQAAQPTRVLVRLTSLVYGYNADNSPQEVTATVYFGRSLAETYTTIQTLQTIMLVLFLFGIGTAAAGAYLLAGQALLPLRMVQRAAEQIGGQTLEQRVPEPDSGDEVQALAQAINRMLDRLEQSFEAQRRFTSDASHELRTPVTAIQGHASYLLRRTSPSEQQRESLGIIKNESERLTGLIGSLLELARSDGGVLQLRCQPVLPLLLMQETARELQPLAQAQGAQLVSGGEEHAVMADPDRLKQVIINLVSNALKVGSAHVSLLSRPETDTGRDAAGRDGAGRDGARPGVRLTVQDDGPGIAPEHLGRLFDRFYRVEESRARDKGGAGLGLAIVKSIVDAHAGRIWIESEPGVGTQVHVWLPVGELPEADEDVA